MSADIEEDAWSSDVVMPVLRVSRSPLLQVWPSAPSCLDTNERDAVVKSKNPQDMMAAMSESMQERTGRSMQEWLAIVDSSGMHPMDQRAVRGWLKAEHGVPQNSQWAIADAAARAAGWERPGTEEYVDQQYSGPKASLRPIFDHVRGIFGVIRSRCQNRGSHNIYAVCATVAVCGRGSGHSHTGGHWTALHGQASLGVAGPGEGARTGDAQAVPDVHGRDHG